LQPDLDPNADLDFVESVREFRRWCDHAGAPRDADPELTALETLASHFEGRFDPLPDFDGLWALAHPAPLPIMRKGSFDLREYCHQGLEMQTVGNHLASHNAAFAVAN
ncbi:MAG: hypothetical protein ACXWCK_33720, partial [Burkholderiales bacterium]